MSGVIRIETVDTGCWIVPDTSIGKAHNANQIQSFEVHCSQVASENKEGKWKLVGYVQPNRTEVKLYTGTEDQCVRMLNKMLKAIAEKMNVIRLWKLGLEIESEDEKGTGMEDRVK